jgi:hypothetical protein
MAPQRNNTLPLDGDVQVDQTPAVVFAHHEMTDGDAEKRTPQPVHK